MRWSFLMFTLLLNFLASAADSVKLEKVTGEKLTRFKWSVYKLESKKDEQSFTNIKLQISENADYIIKDSLLLFILPLDTTAIYLKIYNKETNQVILSQKLSVEENPAYNPEWEKLKFGEIPDIFTEEEYAAFKFFSRTRLLYKQLPDFTTEDVFGRNLSKENLKGKIVLMNFWYYSCIPCRAEIPALNQLKEKYEDNDEVIFLSLYLDSIKLEDKSKFYFYERGNWYHLEYNFNHVANSIEITDNFNVKGYPYTLVIDKNGIVRKIVVGAKMDDANLHLIQLYSDIIDNL